MRYERLLLAAVVVLAVCAGAAAASDSTITKSVSIDQRSAFLDGAIVAEDEPAVGEERTGTDDAVTRADENATPVDGASLGDADLEVVDSELTLTAAEEERISDLVASSNEVVESWTALLERTESNESPETVVLEASDYDNSLVDEDLDDVVRVDVTAIELDSAVTVHVNLEDDELRQVATTYTLDSAATEIDTHALDVEPVETDSTANGESEFALTVENSSGEGTDD